MSDRWVRRWKVQSQSRSDIQYTVTVDHRGRWGCSCWTWRRNQTKDCKHIEATRGDNPEPDEIVSITEPKTKPKIVLANIKEVTQNTMRLGGFPNTSTYKFMPVPVHDGL